MKRSAQSTRKSQSTFVQRYLREAEIAAREEEKRIAWAGKMMREIRSRYGVSLPEAVIDHFFADLMELDEDDPARLSQCDIEAIVEWLSEEE